MNIITLKDADYIPSYIKEKQDKIEQDIKRSYETCEIIKIKLKDENYVPQYQKILNKINDNNYDDVPIIHFSLKTEEEINKKCENEMARTKKHKTEKYKDKK